MPDISESTFAVTNTFIVEFIQVKGVPPANALSSSNNRRLLDLVIIT